MKSLRLLSRNAVVPLMVAVIGWTSVADDALAQRGRGRTKTPEEVIDQAVEFLKSTRSDDGTWSYETHAGITPLVVTALLRSGHATAQDPLVKDALAKIAALSHPEEGYIANDDRIFQRNYMTSVSLLALIAAKDPQYDAVIAKGVEYLKTVQYDEGESRTPADLDYGGFGYRAGTRPDLSNTHFALDALATAGVDSQDPVFQKALIFVSRTQNLASEHNQQDWAKLIGDGSFIYVLASGRPGGGPGAPGRGGPGAAEGQRPAGQQAPAAAQDVEVTPRPGYGAMTYAGVKCLLHAGVSKDDPRFQKGLGWLTKNYSVDHHIGRAQGDGARGYHYYLFTMAKSLHAQQLDALVTADGVSHDWRADITRALSARQQADGSWGNFVGGYLESNTDLDTAYAIITLMYCNPDLAKKN